MNNDSKATSTLNEFPTIDEVNAALEKVKSEIPAPVDLTNYATKSDLLNYRLKTDLNASYLTVEYIDGEVYIDFYHDSYIKGSVVNSLNETIEFDTWFYVENEEKVKSQEIYNNEEFIIYWNSDNYHFWIQKVGDGTQINNITITSAEKGGADTIALIDDVQNMSRIIEKRCEDTYALKSENEELKVKITELEAKIEEIENNWWKKFYYGFTLCNDQTKDNILYRYNASTKEFNMEFWYDFTFNKKESLLIMIGKNNEKHFIRANMEKEEAYIDEIYGPAKYMLKQEFVGTIEEIIGIDINDSSTANNGVKMDFVYAKD